MTTPADVLREARKELGYTESPRGSNRQKFAGEAGHANGQPWCASFIVAIAKRVGLKLPSTSAYTPTMAEGFRKVGRFDKNPRVGDVVFFDFPDSKHRIQHVGWLKSFSDSLVTTIDGNTSSGPSGSEDNGGGVFERTRSRAYVVGFGHPAYQEDDMFTDKDRETLERIEDAVYEKVKGKMVEATDQLRDLVLAKLDEILQAVEAK